MTQPSNAPLAVRRQAREANRLLAELNAPPGAAPPAAAGAPATAPVTVEPFDPNNPAPPAASPPVAAAPPAHGQNQPAPAPAHGQNQPPAEDFQQKYRVLQGKYDSEISRLTGAAQALLEQNQELIRQLNTRPAAPAPTPTPAANPLDKILTAKEREDFGDELIGLIQRIAQAQSGAELQRLNTELGNLKSSMRVTVQEVTENKQAKVYEALNREVPNWQVINNSQQFLDWVEVRDIISGTARKTGLLAAFEAGDVHRVVGIFKRFVEEDSRSRSTAPPATAPVVDAATLIAPAAGRGSAGEAPVGQGGRIWSEQEIDEFYSRVQRNRISPEEKKATEAEIHKAMIEGRIRPRHPNHHLANNA